MADEVGRVNDLLLPPHTRLFHIGPHKTGTTALQGAAHARREELLEHGVRYPGRTFNHRVAVNAFMGRGFGWMVDGEKSTPAPSYKKWQALKDEMERDHERRFLFGHEYASSAEEEHIVGWAKDLGPSLHVVITLRAYSRMLPSLWQETLKRNAGRMGYEKWLRNVLRPEEVGLPGRKVRFDHSYLISRWAQELGPERVTVVALDPADHAFVFHAFEDMLGLPREMLASANPADQAINRSMSTPEAELFRRLNMATRELGLEWPNHEWLDYHGALSRVVATRTPSKDEPKLRLPDWALDLGYAEELKIVQTITDTGVNLIGDSAHLVAGDKKPKAPYIDHRDIAEVPIDLAVTAMVGVIAAATGREAVSFERTPASMMRKTRTDTQFNGAPKVVAQTSTRLIDEVKIRVKRRWKDLTRKLRLSK